MRIVCALLAGTLVGACAHGTPPPLHSTRLVVLESPTAGTVPFVHAKVAGQPLHLLLDTGAIRNILPSEFVRRNKLPLKSPVHNAQMIDSHGQVEVMPLAAGVPVQFEGEASAGTLDFYVSSSSSPTTGILSPQSIVGSGWALVIDLGGKELRYETEESALKRLGGEASSPLRELDSRRCLVEGLFERAHRIVNVKVNGVPSDLIVDTGASHTVLTRNNPAIPSMLALRGNVTTTQAVSSTGSTLLVRDVPIALAGASFVLPVFVNPVRRDYCGQGLLGADVLRYCTLVWGYSSLWAACRPP